ncbi:MAG: FAD-dependent oxidoreductase, partial [Clostridia bacterium]|nr:FAD-dependent oxidoreductase [Clostridia bacterium]
DVIVAGGGIAGISAALASVRAGAKTLLVEREYALGGLATLGLVTIYLPLCDGMGRQCSFGIVEELLKLSISHGAEDLFPSAWLGEHQSLEARKKQRYEVQFSANVFAILCEELLQKEGVDILFGTTLSSVQKEGNRITHLVLEGREGRFAYECGCAIDATGDAILCREAGVPMAHYGRGNTLASWYYYMQNGKHHLQMLGYAENPIEPSTWHVGDRHYPALESEEVSEMMQNAHRQILAHFLKRGDVSEEYALTTIPTIPQLRMTSRIEGEYEMDLSDDGKFMPDSVGMITNWRKAGPVYEVPFRSLYHHSVVNLLTAGRLISANDGMWEITRVIPPCAVTGQAAGTAAAMTQDVTKLDISLLQAKLQQSGVVLHIEDLPQN